MELSDISKYLDSWKRRVLLLISRGEIEKVTTGNGLQWIDASVFKDETIEGAEHFQDYGFSSHPNGGEECVLLFPSGVRGHAICVAVGDRQYRINNLKKGEVALYTDEGDTLILRRNHTIEITTQKFVVNATDSIRFNTPKLEVTGDVIDQAGGGGRSMKDMRAKYNSHTHDVVQGKALQTKEVM